MKPASKIVLPSALLPFRVDQLMQFDYRSFRLTNVFESIDEQQRKACVEMWLRHGVIQDEQSARDRSKEVCYFITERESGELAGVNTLYAGQLVSDGPQVFINRMFIDPKHRSTRLMLIGTGMMVCFARLHLADRGMVGVANVNENRKLSRGGARALFGRLGYQSRGFLQGQEVMRFDFDRVEVVSAQ